MWNTHRMESSSTYFTLSLENNWYHKKRNGQPFHFQFLSVEPFTREFIFSLTSNNRKRLIFTDADIIICILPLKIMQNENITIWTN